MKILLAHLVHTPGVERWYQSVADAAPAGVEVKPFCVTLDAPGPRLHWHQLDRMWQRRDRKLMAMYERMQAAAADCDVTLVYNGANVHPGMLEHLPTFNVFGCFDDPESSPGLSKPVAPAFDAVFYGNVASRFQYESWGCKTLSWLPIFTSPTEVPMPAERDALLAGVRDVDVSLVAERNNCRQQRVDALVKPFPQAKVFGQGWPAGRISDSDLDKLYRRSKIGWNVHNSTGPINRRLFSLAAYGVMPICDNKTGLAQIFKLGEEAVGFDTIPEAIELTRYYLAHDEQRAAIASRAYDRYWQDYHATAIWQRMADQLTQWGAARKQTPVQPVPRRSFNEVKRELTQTALKQVDRAQRVVNKVRSLRQQPAATRPTVDERVYVGEQILPYQENPERKGVNMAEVRLKNGDPLDWPNILALNWATTSLIRDAKQIVEIGSGTGPFTEYASLDPTRQIDCFEEDDFARNKAIELRSKPNVNFYREYNANLRKRYDLLVSVEVIEHVDDLGGFLSFCSSLSPRAIFSTPNRLALRGKDHEGPPPYSPHVREFTPGELYWLLRQHYKQVFLYHMPDVFVPWLEPLTLSTQGTPIIAECLNPVSLAMSQAA